MFFVVVCVCLAISAAYELVEWRVAVGTGSRADDFLGTQGDNWDTQEDMTTALIASLIALITLRVAFMTVFCDNMNQRQR